MDYYDSMVPYNQKFSLDNNFIQPSYSTFALQKYIFSPWNFANVVKITVGSMYLLTWDKTLQDKTHENSVRKGNNFLQAKVSGYTVL